MTRTGSSAGKEGRAQIVSTAPLPCRGLSSLPGSARQERIGRVVNSHEHPPSTPCLQPQGAREVQQLIILAVIPAGWERLPGPAPPAGTGSIRSRRRQLKGPRGITRPRGNAMALSMLMGVAMATPDQMMGTPAKAIEAGAGGAGGPELSQPHGHHLALGWQGHLGVFPWVPYSHPH